MRAGSHGTTTIDVRVLPTMKVESASNKGDDSTSSDLANVVKENIRDVSEHREAHRQSLTGYERAATAIAESISQPASVVLHVIVFGGWTLLNVGWFGLKPFDPYPFGLLTTIVSLEAIILTLFVLLSQSRMQRLSDRQNNLDLQVNLLTEHELTRVLIAVDLIAHKLGIDLPHSESNEDLKTDVAAHAVLEEIEKQSQEPSSQDEGEPTDK
jgi:uncharacterized membrane protein